MMNSLIISAYIRHLIGYKELWRDLEALIFSYFTLNNGIRPIPRGFDLSHELTVLRKTPINHATILTIRMITNAPICIIYWQRGMIYREMYLFGNRGDIFTLVSNGGEYAGFRLYCDGKAGLKSEYIKDCRVTHFSAYYPKNQKIQDFRFEILRYTEDDLSEGSSKDDSNQCLT